jgi:hypothetical protein
MELEIIMLSEISQTEKGQERSHALSHTQNLDLKKNDPSVKQGLLEVGTSGRGGMKAEGEGVGGE